VGLKEYAEKRDFRRTPEPAHSKPGRRKHGAPRFVVHMHAATRLHYDFRLEHRGVLLSWAVPKGPSLDPAVKRLAVEVEDHPLPYGTFEGTIPKGEYGGGSVIVWDRGTWHPEGDVDDSLRRGSLTFQLQGERLRGSWKLVRMGARGEQKPQWLLIKHDDADAVRGDGSGVVDENPTSVVTNRTVADVAAGVRTQPKERASARARPALQARRTVGSRVESKPESELKKPRVPTPRGKSTAQRAASGSSRARFASPRGETASRTAKRTAPRTKSASSRAQTASRKKTDRTRPEPARARQASRSSARAARAPAPSRTRAPAEGAVRGPLPDFVPPQLALLVDAIPEGSDWVHEVKFDGYRMQIRRDARDVAWTSRNGLDWSENFRDLDALVLRLPCRSALIDAEVVVLRDDGTTSFSDLQQALSEDRGGEYVAFGFDLLHLDGWDLRDSPLIERKRLLAKLVGKRDARLRYSEHAGGHGRELLPAACAHGLEGIISKRVTSPYVSGRGGSWTKTKCANAQEFVVVGWSPSKIARSGLGALLLAHYDGAVLRAVGRVGSGIDTRSAQDLIERLIALERKKPDRALAGVDDARGVRWVRPQLVVQIAFGGWTRDEKVRQARFLGLRADKAAKRVIREVSRAAAPASAARVVQRKQSAQARGRSPQSKATLARSRARTAETAKPMKPAQAANAGRGAKTAPVAAAGKSASTGKRAMAQPQASAERNAQVGRNTKARRSAKPERSAKTAPVAAAGKSASTGKRAMAQPHASAERNAQVGRNRKPGRSAKTRANASTPPRTGARSGRVDAHDSPRLTHPDRVVDAQSTATKADVARYVERYADRILEHVAGRPVSLMRCPAGVGGKCFFQRHANAQFSSAVGEIAVGGDARYVVVEDARGLAALVQMNVLELHPWGCHPHEPERPDRMTFDLDPGEDVSWSRVVEAAREVRALLQRLDLDSLVKTSGGKGLHVVAPLTGQDDWTHVSAFARAVADQLAADDDRFVATSAKRLRHGRIFVDYLRNQRAATAVAAWSPRARPGLSISMPVTWTALGRTKRADGARAADLASAKLPADAWRAWSSIHQRLPRIARR